MHFVRTQTGRKLHILRYDGYRSLCGVMALIHADAGDGDVCARCRYLYLHSAAQEGTDAREKYNKYRRAVMEIDGDDVPGAASSGPPRSTVPAARRRRVARDPTRELDAWIAAGKPSSREIVEGFIQSLEGK